MNATEEVLKLLGEVVASGGGGAVIAYLIFQYLGKSWIDTRFAQRLEAFRHEQAREIEHLRMQIESMLSGTLRLQEKEFETLPEAWRLLDIARGQVASLLSPLQRYPNLDQMSSPQLEEFFVDSELLESQKEELRASSRKLDTYQEQIFWHRLSSVKLACSDLHNFVARNAIFIPEPVSETYFPHVDIVVLRSFQHRVCRVWGGY